MQQTSIDITIAFYVYRCTAVHTIFIIVMHRAYGQQMLSLKKRTKIPLSLIEHFILMNDAYNILCINTVFFT